MRKHLSVFLLAVAAFIFGVPVVASAHEAYVLDRTYFWSVMHGPMASDVLKVFHNAHDIHVMIEIIVAVLILLSLNFFVRMSGAGKRVNDWFERRAFLGQHFVRIAVAGAFFFGARSMSFLGPELPMSQMPWPHLMQIGLYAASVCIFAGFLTELAALLALVIFTIGFLTFGLYLMTYLNYLGEIIVLILFGMRSFSFDRLIFGPLKRFPRLAQYETTIIRVFYGVALLWAAITVKLLHPELTVTVIDQWNLTRFHWLFPGDPLLVTLGAGIVEAVIGIFIAIGFEMRMTILISLFYITLSLMYFRELVWPHILLYGISFNLLVQPENFTLDHLFFEHERKKKPVWRRLLSPHKKEAPDSK